MHIHRITSGPAFIAMTILSLGIGKASATDFAAESGMHFESNGVTVDASGEITLLLVASEESVQLLVSAGQSNTILALAGLAPGASYYLYKDNFHNVEIVLTDVNGRLSFVLDASLPRFVSLQTNPSTLFIRDDATPCIFIA